MSTIKNLAIERITRQLENLGCQFKVITEDGAEFGTLEVVSGKPKITRIHKRYVHETNYIELLKDLKAGDSAFIPAGTAPLEGLQSTCAAYMLKNYGKGTYMTVQHAERNGVEVLRLE